MATETYSYMYSTCTFVLSCIHILIFHLFLYFSQTKGNKILIFEYCDCDNFSYLIGALYVYKGLLAIFGLFLAYESRNVKYLYINDSRFVSIAMYIVVILIGIGAPLSLVFAGQRLIDPAYGVAAVMIVTACTSCLLILYVPKVCTIIAHFVTVGVITILLLFCWSSSIIYSKELIP